jgi:hypothetical protein
MREFPPIGQSCGGVFPRAERSDDGRLQGVHRGGEDATSFVALTGILAFERGPAERFLP